MPTKTSEPQAVDHIEVAKQGIAVAERRLEREAAFQPIAPESTLGGAQLLSLARQCPPMDDRRKAIFLEALAQVPDEHLAALSAGVTIIVARAEKRTDQAFAAAWEMAANLAVGFAEKEAFRRAVEGVTKRIYHQGNPVGTEQVYSDSLMARILEAGNPRYERKSQVKADVTANFNWGDLVNAMRSTGNSEE